jgi:hypothetical protein
MDLAGTADVMEKLNKSMDDFRLPPWITNPIAAFNAYSYLASGNLNAAVKWAKERNLSVDDKLYNLDSPSKKVKNLVVLDKSSR